jgi:hypothetical protein
MDAITKDWLLYWSNMFPKYAITLSHQFLDGDAIHECGIIPNNWNGKRKYINVKKSTISDTKAWH